MSYIKKVTAFAVTFFIIEASGISGGFLCIFSDQLSSEKYLMVRTIWLV